MISNPLLVACWHCLLARLLVPPIGKDFLQQQGLFPFPHQPRKASKKQTSQMHNFPSCKTQKKQNQSSKTKNKNQKTKEKKQNQRISKTQKEANPKLRKQKQQNQSSKHPKLPTQRSKTKENSKQTPPKLLTLNLLRCNSTCFCAAAAAAATTTAIPLQLQSSRKLHYPKAQKFCFSLQQPNDDFCFSSPFFKKLFEKNKSLILAIIINFCLVLPLPSRPWALSK